MRGPPLYNVFTLVWRRLFFYLHACLYESTDGMPCSNHAEIAYGYCMCAHDDIVVTTKLLWMVTPQWAEQQHRELMSFLSGPGWTPLPVRLCHIYQDLDGHHCLSKTIGSAVEIGITGQWGSQQLCTNQ